MDTIIGLPVLFVYVVLLALPEEKYCHVCPTPNGMMFFHSVQFGSPLLSALSAPLLQRSLPPRMVAICIMSPALPSGVAGTSPTTIIAPSPSLGAFCTVLSVIQ